MIIRAEFSINVYDLFVHDQDQTHDLDEAVLARRVEKHLQDTLPYSDEPWRVIAGDESGLDRMTLTHGAQRWAEKYRNRDAVRAAFPAEVVAVLDTLNDRRLTWNRTV